MNNRLFRATGVGSHGCPLLSPMWLGHPSLMDVPIDPYTIHYLINVNTMQFRHICDNASMTAVVLYGRHDLLGTIRYLL
jgi:hypothetical protein